MILFTLEYNMYNGNDCTVGTFCIYPRYFLAIVKWDYNNTNDLFCT